MTALGSFLGALGPRPAHERPSIKDGTVGLGLDNEPPPGY